MEEEIKKISEEKLDYYRNNIEHCPIDILRVLYAELKQTFEYIDHEHGRLDKRNNELIEENEELKDLYIRTAKHLEEIGKQEMAEYFLAQIEAIPTWNVGEM